MITTTVGMGREKAQKTVMMVLMTESMDVIVIASPELKQGFHVQEALLLFQTLAFRSLVRCLKTQLHQRPET